MRGAPFGAFVYIRRFPPGVARLPVKSAVTAGGTELASDALAASVPHSTCGLRLVRGSSADALSFDWPARPRQKTRAVRVVCHQYSQGLAPPLYLRTKIEIENPAQGDKQPPALFMKMEQHFCYANRAGESLREYVFHPPGKPPPHI